MTNEEKDRAIHELQNSINVGLCPDIESRKVAIKALEQQPCGDCISRQAALEKIHWLGLDNDTTIKCDLAIRALSPVNPQEPKTGHWIESRCDMYVCSECGNTYTDLSGERYGMNCCPNCGAKMVEPQESEEV